MPRGRKPKYPQSVVVGEFLLLDQPQAWVFRHNPESQRPITAQDVTAALSRRFGIPASSDTPIIRDVSIDALDLPSRVIAPLASMGVRTIEQLLAVRRVDLMARGGVGVVSLRRIREELLDLLFPPTVGNGKLDKLDDFEAVVSDFVRRAISDDRRVDLALGRLSPGTARPEALKAFGEELGLSRERIRQIVADSYDSLRKPAKLALLNPLWNAMWACLEAQAKPIAPEKLAQALGRRLNWSQAPDASAVERLCRLHPNLLITTQHVSINADWPT